MLRKVKIPLFVVLILSISYLLFLFVEWNYLSTHYKEDVKQTLKNDFMINSINYELSFVKDDLLTYGYSERYLKLVVSSMKKASEDYKIPIGLLHAIFRIESDYRFNITHPTVVIDYKGKKITTNAIGLGGIIWEFWGDSLKANNIADHEMDLYLPDVNIKASAYILRKLINQELSTNKQSFSMANIIRRYYGAYSQLYMEKMIRVTSDLWLKRITKEVIANFEDNYTK
jgi:soluble lytic murein transglycosylase-like protein